MSERRVEYVPLASLAPNPANVKLHDEAAVAASLGRFGLADLVAVDGRTGLIVEGHGRVEALRAAQAAGEAPPGGVRAGDGDWLVPVVVGWASANDDEAAAVAVALNQWTVEGGWDTVGLLAVLERITETGGDVAALGFSQQDRDDLAALLEEMDGSGEFGFDPDAYLDRQVRSLIFDYPLDDYRRVTEMAAAARPGYGVESNAELFLAMVREAAGGPEG